MQASGNTYVPPLGDRLLCVLCDPTISVTATATATAACPRSQSHLRGAARCTLLCGV